MTEEQEHEFTQRLFDTVYVAVEDQHDGAFIIHTHNTRSADDPGVYTKRFTTHPQIVDELETLRQLMTEKHVAFRSAVMVAMRLQQLLIRSQKVLEVLDEDRFNISDAVEDELEALPTEIEDAVTDLEIFKEENHFVQ